MVRLHLILPISAREAKAVTVKKGLLGKTYFAEASRDERAVDTGSGGSHVQTGASPLPKKELFGGCRMTCFRHRVT